MVGSHVAPVGGRWGEWWFSDGGDASVGIDGCVACVGVGAWEAP